MSESGRRLKLIRDVALGSHNATPKTKASLMVAVKELKKERPQLFHGTKDHPIYTPIRNEQDVEDLRNSMACGNYPLTMTDCEVIGINGDCGSNCPVLLREECEYQDEMLDAYYESPQIEEEK